VKLVLERQGIFDHLDDFLQAASGLTNGSHLIITSRVMPLAFESVACRLIPVREEELDVRLEGLAPADSIELLKRLHVRGPDDVLENAASAYGHHPLTLVVLAGIIKQRYGGDIQRYLDGSRRRPNERLLDPRRELHKLLADVRNNLPGKKLSELVLSVAA